MTAVEMMTALLRVAALAFTFGVGIPLLFSLAIKCMTGNAIRDEDGYVVADTEASPQMRLLGQLVYVFLAFVIIVAIAWIARETIHHYLGIALFPGMTH